jgi:hypothetical protein
MFIQLGLTCFFICAINLIFMVREVVHYTPNWKDTDVDADEISSNFLANATPESLKFIRQISNTNKAFFMSGLFMIMVSLIH